MTWPNSMPIAVALAAALQLAVLAQGNRSSSQITLRPVAVNPIPEMIGLRIENPEDMVPNKDEMIPRVHPEVDIFVTMFGLNMDQVAAVLFSPRPDCDEMPWMDPIMKFPQQYPNVLTVKTRFPVPDVDELYYVCLLTKDALKHHIEQLHQGNADDVDDESKLKNISAKIFRSTTLKPLSTTEVVEGWADYVDSPDDPPTSLFLFQGSENHHIFVVTEMEDEIEMPVALQIFIIICLLLFSSLLSGLNLGLMSLDETELKIFMNSGTANERRYSRVIYPIRKRGNYLLCTILFIHVTLNSAVSILFDDLFPGFVALCVSSLFIVIFAEIVPQAVCSRHGLAIGARCVTLIKILMILTAPLSWPTSKILDYALGKDVGTVYNRERLLELIRLSKDLTSELKNCHEVAIVTGALELGSKFVKDVMTPLRDAFMLSRNAILDTKTVSMITRSGFTRIPVYDGERENVVMLLNVKDLLLYNPDDRIPLKTICQFYQHPVRIVPEDLPLNDMLNEFKLGQYHMAFIERVGSKASRKALNSTAHSQGAKEVVGLITLEDILEEILQCDILDETDIAGDRVSNICSIKPVRQDTVGDLTAFIPDEDTESQVVSPQLAIAAYQFLSTSFEPFNAKNINDKVLQCLIKQHIYKTRAPEAGTAPKLLYTKGKVADYFILILEGRCDVVSGVDNIQFEAGPFFMFGKKILADISDTSSAVAILERMKQKPYTFTPDYTVSVTKDLVYFQLKATNYLNAINATMIENKTAFNSVASVVVYQLLENASNQNLPSTEVGSSGELPRELPERRASIAAIPSSAAAAETPPPSYPNSFGARKKSLKGGIPPV